MVARWGILFEAGFELVDTINNVLYPLINNKFEFGNFIAVVHHITLYFALPINQFLLPSKIGRDVAMATFLYAGMPCIMAPFQFMKNYVEIDLATAKGKILYSLLLFVPIMNVGIPRSVHWCYFA